ncbi:MAG TPA: hypothetical protein VFQ39_10355, partial [Longimicrobium sp.]|nr:hypothetical protein [Longimicrobium sp.]
MTRHRLLLGLVVITFSLLSSIPASAQALSYSGFLAGGRGGANNPLLDSKWMIGAGYEGRIGFGGLELGLRSSASYSRFEADVGAYVDSVGATSGSLTDDGGEASVTQTGIDGVVGLRLGRSVGVYGFYGMHWFHDSRTGFTLETDEGPYEFSTRVESNLGTMRGFGAELRIPSAGGGFFGEW